MRTIRCSGRGGVSEGVSAQGGCLPSGAYLPREEGVSAPEVFA